ncbi:MAG: DUF429 domain-containing protein [Acidobacteria bacterium]|nr:DUF429 domain-containing protein [Acidobacteriota bacterium]
MNRVYGVDGCHGGWVVAEAGVHLDKVTFWATRNPRKLFEKACAECVILIDIPIGVPDDEPRACDMAARQLLGWPRRSSVFSPPCRRALTARTFPEALRCNREVLGTGISKQAYFIMSKIREVDELMNTSVQRYVREAHPEVIFARLNGAPMIHNKKRAAGRAERLAVLQRAGLNISDVRLSEERARLGRAQVAPDDLLDAAACLVAAFHVRAGRGQSVGRVNQTDAKGLLMEIVFCRRLDNAIMPTGAMMGIATSPSPVMLAIAATARSDAKLNV